MVLVLVVQLVRFLCFEEQLLLPAPQRVARLLRARGPQGGRWQRRPAKADFARRSDVLLAWSPRLVLLLLLPRSLLLTGFLLLLRLLLLLLLRVVAVLGGFAVQYLVLMQALGAPSVVRFLAGLSLALPDYARRSD
jgi:hypothetical protein